MTAPSIRLSVEGLTSAEHHRIIDLLTEGGTNLRDGVVIDTTVEAASLLPDEPTPAAGTVWVDVLPKLGTGWLSRPTALPVDDVVERLAALPAGSNILVAADEPATAVHWWEKLLELLPDNPPRLRRVSGREFAAFDNGTRFSPVVPTRFEHGEFAADAIVVVGAGYSDALASFVFEQWAKKAPWLVSVKEA